MTNFVQARRRVSKLKSLNTLDDVAEFEKKREKVLKKIKASTDAKKARLKK